MVDIASHKHSDSVTQDTADEVIRVEGQTEIVSIKEKKRPDERTRQGRDHISSEPEADSQTHTHTHIDTQP